MRAARRLRWPLLAAILALLGLTGGPSSSAAETALAAPARQAPPTSGAHYRLVDTWSDVPWTLRAGHYGYVGDVSVGPSGALYVLDTGHEAVHVLAPDGTPRTVFRVPVSEKLSYRSLLRLDVGPDDSVFVLSSGPTVDGVGVGYAVARFRPDGTSRHEFVLRPPRGSRYFDIAAAPDGGLYFSRRGAAYRSATGGCGAPTPGSPTPTPTPTATTDGAVLDAVEVRATDGTARGTLTTPALVRPGRLDVAPDGTLYVVNEVPTPDDCLPPGPTPTPDPSLLGLGAAAAPRPDGLGNGVLAFGPDGRLRQLIPFNDAGDVAAGPEAVFVSHGLELYRLGEDRPFYTRPEAIVVARAGESALRLAAPPSGGVVAALFHCHFQGLLRFERPVAGAAPSIHGALDFPALEGPLYPMRLDAAGDTVAVLQGRYMTRDERPNQRYLVRYMAGAHQSVQRWSTDGQLLDQLGVCSGAQSTLTQDVALTSEAVYVAAPEHVRRRPNLRFPDWSFFPAAMLDLDGTPMLTAVAADDEQLVALDAGRGAVWVLGPDGTVRDRWPIAPADGGALPVDIALVDGRVYVADAGRSRVLGYDLAGRLSDAWPTHADPYRLDIGPTGEVYILTRAGWALRYTPAGRLVGAWTMPERDPTALDLAVGDDGRVYISYVVLRGWPPPGPRFDERVIDDAGIWVFAPHERRSAPVVPPGACLVHGDKRAVPGRVALDEPLAVALTVDGWCPGTDRRTQIMVALDVSRSMSYTNHIWRAQQAVALLLERLDADRAEVGVVTFDFEAELVQPLTDDPTAVLAAALGHQVWSGTYFSPAIEQAHAELVGPRGDPDARRVILFVTDGTYSFKDSPLEAAAAARADGIEFYFVVWPAWNFSEQHEYELGVAADDPGRVRFAPGEQQQLDLFDEIRGYAPQDDLLRTLTVEDVLADDMHLVRGSIDPPPDGDTTSGRLSWQLGGVRVEDGVRLRYRLRPQVAGRQPISIEATGTYEDASGHSGRLAFPVPQVDVSAGLVRLPFAARDVPLR